jgi:curli production assembly/transport component CsgG
MRRSVLLCSCILAVAALGGCATSSKSLVDAVDREALPVIPEKTTSQRALQQIPPPSRPIAIAVYGFTDQTGQFKPTDTGQTLSRAVTQGASSMLVKALQDAGQRRWFTIVEREQLKNLLQERQIIREMRERYLGEKEVNAEALPALLFAGVLLEGGIIGYDTNTVSGGLGARFLGVGASTQYRQDTVTVYLRAVSVRTGEVLTSVQTSKTIASVQLGANAFRFVSFKEILEAEAGITTNEPDQVALQQAIEKAVYGLVMEGVELKLWNFADVQAGWPMFWRYTQEREGVLSAKQIAHLQEQERRDRGRAVPVPPLPAEPGARKGDPARTAKLPPPVVADAVQSSGRGEAPAALLRTDAAGG